MRLVKVFLLFTERFTLNSHLEVHMVLYILYNRYCTKKRPFNAQCHTHTHTQEAQYCLAHAMRILWYSLAPRSVTPSLVGASKARRHAQSVVCRAMPRLKRHQRGCVAPRVLASIGALLYNSPLSRRAAVRPIWVLNCNWKGIEERQAKTGLPFADIYIELSRALYRPIKIF